MRVERRFGSVMATSRFWNRRLARIDAGFPEGDAVSKSMQIKLARR